MYLFIVNFTTVFKKNKINYLNNVNINFIKINIMKYIKYIYIT